MTAALAHRPPNLLDVEKARAFLAECRDLHEIRKVKDQAEAMTRYLRAQRAAEESFVHAATIARWAERRLGEVVVDMPKASGSKGIGKKLSAVASRDHTPTLSDHGITKSQSSRWQAVASVPEKKFAATIAEAVAAKKPPTLSALLKVEREIRLGKSYPSPKAFHPLTAFGALKEKLSVVIHSTIAEWPAKARGNVAGLLRDLAEDLEKEFPC